MRLLSEDEEDKVKETLESQKYFRRSMLGNPGSFSASKDKTASLDRESIERSEEDIEQKIVSLIEDEDYDKLYGVVYEEFQWAPKFSKKFENKYKNSSIELTPSEISTISEDLLEVNIVPNHMDWIIVFNHDGNIFFHGNKKFRKKVKNIFKTVQN